MFLYKETPDSSKWKPDPFNKPLESVPDASPRWLSTLPNIALDARAAPRSMIALATTLVGFVPGGRPPRCCSRPASLIACSLQPDQEPADVRASLDRLFTQSADPDEDDGPAGAARQHVQTAVVQVPELGACLWSPRQRPGLWSPIHRLKCSSKPPP